MEDKYRPISAWGYVLYDILFSIPLVGFVFLLVFSFSKKNINKRNYARRFFCYYLIFGILAIAALVIAIFVFKINIPDLLNKFGRLS